MPRTEYTAHESEGFPLGIEMVSDEGFYDRLPQAVLAAAEREKYRKDHTGPLVIEPDSHHRLHLTHQHLEILRQQRAA